MDCLIAYADDERWREFADVVIYRAVPEEPLSVALNTLERLPGCALVAVPIRPGGCVLAVRDRPPLIVFGPVDVKTCAVTAYSTLLSLARTEAALGSSTCS